MEIASFSSLKIDDWLIKTCKTLGEVFSIQCDTI